MKKFTYVLAALGAVAATAGTVGTILFWWDEPKMPKSLLK